MVHPSYHAVSLPGNLRWEKAQGDWVQAHVHPISDAIQPSHPLLSLSPAPNPLQHGQIEKKKDTVSCLPQDFSRLDCLEL